MLLLRPDRSDGVGVLSVSGAVTAAEAGRLVDAVQQSWSQVPRGVVVDLREVTSLAAEAVTGLAGLADRTRPWPHPSLSLCGVAVPGLPAHEDVDEALAHVDDRSSAPRERVELPYGPTGPGCAREAVTRIARRFGLEGLLDDVELVVSEMVTNAVRHARAPVSLELQPDGAGVLVAVADGSPQEPLARGADHEAEGGRGLLLVDLLSVEHGVRPEPPGKTVWASLALPHPS